MGLDMGVSRLTGIAAIGVCLNRALGDLEVAFVGDLVQGVLATRKDLAGITVTGEERIIN